MDSQSEVITAVVLTSDRKKKRGRRPKVEGSAPDTTWNTVMVEQLILLETRYNSDFKNSKIKQL